VDLRRKLRVALVNSKNSHGSVSLARSRASGVESIRFCTGAFPISAGIDPTSASRVPRNANHRCSLLSFARVISSRLLIFVTRPLTRTRPASPVVGRTMVTETFALFGRPLGLPASLRKSGLHRRLSVANSGATDCFFFVLFQSWPS